MPIFNQLSFDNFPFAGYTHEHNREDRMKFVDINEKSIMEEELKNFNQKEVLNYGTMSTPYDFRYHSQTN